MVTNYIVRGESFIVDKPRVWFGKQLANVGLAVNYDLAPDGQRFVVVMPAESPEPRETQSHVTQPQGSLHKLNRSGMPAAQATFFGLTDGATGISVLGLLDSFAP